MFPSWVSARAERSWEALHLEGFLMAAGSERQAARFQKDTAEAAFAPPRANMVLAASAAAFDRPNCVPVVVRERRTADLCGRLIPSAVWGARGWDRGAIDGGVEAVPRCTSTKQARTS